MGGCQNYGSFLGTLNIRCRIIIGTQKGTIILTTTHIHMYIYISSRMCTHMWTIGKTMETTLEGLGAFVITEKTGNYYLGFGVLLD